MVSNIKEILHPTDFSPAAKNALIFALEIARSSGATLHIMHSIEEPYNFYPISKAPNLSHRVKKILNEHEEDISKGSKYKELNIKTCIQTGGALYAIFKEVKNRNIDLIVMGTKGRTGLNKILLGSTTAEVIQRSNVPVLVVPKEAEYDGFKQIIFATDYQEGDIEALKFVSDFTELFNSNIKVFHSSLENNFKNKITFRGFMEVAKESIPFKNIDFGHHTTISFFEAISGKVFNGNISLLVMTRYKQSFSIFTEKMSYYTTVPLLILPGNYLKDQ